MFFERIRIIKDANKCKLCGEIKSANYSGCCLKCEKKEGCQGQVCSQPFKDHEGQRWDTWMHLVTTQLTHLLKYIPKELRKKYGIKPKCPAHHARGKSTKRDVSFAGLIERAKDKT